jgi:putative acyl-CoA dehydrogenase
MKTTAFNALCETHQVENQPQPLENYNTFLSDKALQEALSREGASWAVASLTKLGAELGDAETIQWGYQANENPPTFQTHDRYGNRVDLISFHPSYHQLWQIYRREGMHASPWTDPKPGAHVARAARTYMLSQIEAGQGCPGTMTFAAPPVLKLQPELADKWLPLLTNEHYDPRNIPVEQKKGITMGMAITEKQGGSDVRANTCQAQPVGTAGPGKAYELIGHKYFVSGAMGDAFFVTAQAQNGLSCFLVPRWRPDGSKNPLQIQQLKNKMGNVSNATAETELRGALGWLIGEEGQGIKTIMKAIVLTRYDCMLGSSAGMRQAIAQASHHCSQRSAFGKKLTDQVLMQNVLADLALESEASLAYLMRMARAMDNTESDYAEKQLARIGIAIGKYWICKRTPLHAYEAMECIGGSGVMEDSIMARLFRESPINAIWEGSGNVQALDVLRAIATTPDSLEAYWAELKKTAGLNTHYDRYLQALDSSLHNLNDREYRAREIVEKLALAMQASILLQSGQQIIAESFCMARLQENRGMMYGTLEKGIDCAAIVKRTTPLFS